MEQKIKVGDRVMDRFSKENGIVMRIYNNQVKIDWDSVDLNFREEEATWWPMDDFELIETPKKSEWPKIVTTSRFYGECNGTDNFGFEATDDGLVDTNEDLWVMLDEIPAFVEWLQTEYKRRKGE